MLLAPELKIKLLLSQAEKDNLVTFCYADLPRANLRRALRVRGLLQHFDGLLFQEIMSEMTSAELRRLGDKTQTLWLRTPEECDYSLVLDQLGPRRRLLPRALKLAKQLKDIDSSTIFESDAE